MKTIFPRCKNALAYYNAGIVNVNVKIVGLAPGAIKTVFTFMICP
jgi:hypothetical protein